MSEAAGGDSLGARVAGEDELDGIAETMALAFREDPTWNWALPRPERRLGQLWALWRYLLGAAVGYGWVWSAAAGASAALWIPPGRSELPPEDEERLDAILTEMLGDAAGDRVLALFEHFDASHPTGTPHYYLSLLATHPERRGRGTGIALLAENLARIDAEGYPAYLESTNPANEPRYEALGFADCGRIELPEGGPEVTQMWREPR